MSRRVQIRPFTLSLIALPQVMILVGALLIPSVVWCETYGIIGPDNEFQVKVSIDVRNTDILIKKIDPQEKFSSISIQVNARNSALLRNVNLLRIEWIDARNRAGRPIPFTGPFYDPNTRTFQDTMVKSVALKILNTSTRKLFGGKPLADLFRIKINKQPLVSQESVSERERTVKMGAGRDVSINVDRNVIVFNEDNFKQGEILNVDNRSGLDQALGVELPSVGLVYDQIIRKPEQTKIPREQWNRFTVAADSGIFIVLIPEQNAALLPQLDGKEVVIKVYEGNRVRETRRIPIKIAADLKLPGRELPMVTEPASPDAEARREYTENDTSAGRRVTSEERTSPGTQEARVPGKSAEAREPLLGSWIWVLQIINLVLVIGLACYGMFFLLPKIQVLEDRLAKNEMFIHGSREAIREELEQIKEEILRQCLSNQDSE